MVRLDSGEVVPDAEAEADAAEGDEADGAADAAEAGTTQAAAAASTVAVVTSGVRSSLLTFPPGGVWGVPSEHRAGCRGSGANEPYPATRRAARAPGAPPPCRILSKRLNSAGVSRLDPAASG